MPERSSRVKEAYDESPDGELPYISKSRVMQWLKNPEHFRLKYLEEIKQPETEAMVRGTEIHEIFEDYYNRAPGGSMATALDRLPGNHRRWADYTEPYIANFLAWEQRRKSEVDGIYEHYAPVAVEEEHWREPLIDDGPEWMGLADVIVPAQSVPEIESDTGVVVVDFKTGSVPDEKYRHPGIYTELEYYTMLFEDEYNIAGSGAYYPREDEFIAQPDDIDHRETIYEAVTEIVNAAQDYDGGATFKIEPGPLCGWSPDPDDRSPYYGICSECTWNVPVQNENTFRALVDEGYSDTEIADHLGCEPNECSYWRYKLDL